MRVLIIKTSSLGDVIHTLPALTDAGKAIPDISFDWVVEENFSEAARWHPLVKNIIPVSLRHWRKNIFTQKTYNDWRAFRKLLRAAEYDLIIDAQGLLKSAFIALNARGKCAGFNFSSARDPLASFFYNKKFATAKVKEQHAIMRIRDLFSQALGYKLPTTVPDYGIDRHRFQQENHSQKYLVFLHGTTWTTKHWPETYWIELAKLANDKGFLIKLPWGTTAEQERASRIAAVSPNAEILPRQDLSGMAVILANAHAIVAVDTGLGHLAAALNVPTISLYGATNPILTGALGQSQKHLTVDFPCSPCLSRECTYRDKQKAINPPCFSTLSPMRVWTVLADLM